LATAIVCVAGEARSRLSAADEYWHRAAADQRCNGNGNVALPMEELTDHYEDVNIRAICSDEPDRIGPPKQVGLDGQYRAGDLCNAEAALSMNIAGRFVYTLIFNVLLLSYLTFNLWSFYKLVSDPQPQGRSYSPRSVNPSSSPHGTMRATQLQPLGPAIGQPVAIATAVAAPVSGEAPSPLGEAVATPAVAVATVASPGVAVGTMAVATAVGTPAIAVGTPAMGVELQTFGAPPPLPLTATRVP